MAKMALVIGAQNAGKSTLIRGIAGCPTKKYKGFVWDCIRGKCVYVFCSSPQEDSSITDACYSEALRQAAEEPRCAFVLLAVQPSRPRLRISLEHCVARARDQGITDLRAFVIEHPHSPNGADLSAEEMACLRERLNQLGITDVTPVDNRLLLAGNVVKCWDVLRRWAGW